MDRGVRDGAVAAGEHEIEGHGQDDAPAVQVIVLGSGGGPREDNTTAFLVRSVATEWKRGSVLAVDAGVHLAAIARILKPDLQLPTVEAKSDSSSDPSSSLRTLTSGPFSGLQIPHISAEANAAHITRTLIDTYLITHPHLDHISGFVVNTAALPGARPKRLAGLPTTIQAFKTHIFNSVIWPNLSDENNGAGLVTYLRLVEGGSPALGAGEGKGYIEVCEGLSVKTYSVSHGHCMEKHAHRGSTAGIPAHALPEGHATPTSSMHSHAHISPYANSMTNVGFPHLSPQIQFDERICVYDSSAYFIRDIASGSEILIFGDVEPDSISLSPRNDKVWAEAAPKVASGVLKAIFIECSYDDSRQETELFGHLAPRFVIQELLYLAEQVYIEKTEAMNRSQELSHSSASTTGTGSGSASTATQAAQQAQAQANASAVLESRKRKRPSHIRTRSSSQYLTYPPIHGYHGASSGVQYSPSNRRDSLRSNASNSASRHRSQTPESGSFHAQHQFQHSRLDERGVSPLSTKTRATNSNANAHSPQHLGPFQLEQYDLKAAQQRKYNNGNPNANGNQSHSNSQPGPGLGRAGQGHPHSRKHSLVDRSLSISLESPRGTEDSGKELKSNPHSSSSEDATPTALETSPSTAVKSHPSHTFNPHQTSPTSSQELPTLDEESSSNPIPEDAPADSNAHYLPASSSTDAEADAEAEVDADTFTDDDLPPVADSLAGLKVVIIHIKDNLTDETPSIDEVIISQLRDLASRDYVGLKCEFVAAKEGASFYI